jgi:hypothetical protein
MARSVFMLRVQAEPGVHVIRSLRAWLKEGLRTFGLRCVSIEEVTRENTMVDVRKYTSGVVMPEDLRDGPRTERIISVYINEKHDVPVLEFESGDQLFAWPSIGRVLARAYGYETDDWRGHIVKLSHGTYPDRKTGETKDTIIIEAVSSRDGTGNSGAQRMDPAKLPAPVAKRTIADDLSDEMPF